jgi:E3 ubiquitin-protein ligase synoviolin
MSLCLSTHYDEYTGKLRDVEVELLVDKLKYYIMDISLALTIFRNELNLGVLGQFLLLLFLKSFHWLAKARLDYLEQIHPVPILMHIRQTSLLIFLFICDLGLGYYCLDYTITKGKSVLILFGFELILLFLSVVNIFIRYILQITDNSLPNGLHSKGLYIMILDLIHDALAFVIYVCFFGLVFHYYGLPLHIVR